MMKKIITLFLILFYLNSFGQINYFFWAHSGFGNVLTSDSFTKNNCAACYEGNTDVVTIPVGTFTSYVSQADADTQASTYLHGGYGQTYANNNFGCTALTVYWNDNALSGEYVKDNCASGSHSEDTYYGSVSPNEYSSCISQDDANSTAQNTMDSEGQAYANAHGSCVSDVCTRPGGLTTYTFVPWGSEFGYSGQWSGTDGTLSYDGTGTDCTYISDGNYNIGGGVSVTVVGGVTSVVM